MASPSVPIVKLREFFFRLNVCRSRNELMHEASAGIGRIIPFDETAGVFDAATGANVAGVGKSDACTAAYNNYYRKIRPRYETFILNSRADLDSEYVVDFVRPNGLYKCLWYHAPGYALQIRIGRSRLSQAFTELDLQNLMLVDDYLNNLCARFDKGDTDVDSPVSAGALSARFRFLSRREAEVCCVLARRLSTAEIAAVLFISPRTVEKHVENIFDKFDVRSREQLRWRLGDVPPS